MLKKTACAIVVLLLLSTSFLVSTAYTQTIVVPPQFKNQAGLPTESIFVCTLLPNGTRIQALYPASDLIAGTINGFNIRTIEGFPDIAPFSVSDITVTMSTTSVQDGDLSTIFADNTGPDAQTVFSGALNISPIPACNTSPCPFNIPITFQTPFDYNPSDGNLLLDIIVPSCMDGNVPLILVDSTFELDSIFATDSIATDGNPGFWNITQFVYSQRLSSVPTISEWGLIAMVGGLGLIGFFVIRRGNSTAQNKSL